MPHPDTTTSDAGFTLIEVIVSFVILATVLGSMTLSLSYSARMHRDAETKRRATTCAESVLAGKLGKQRDLPDTESGAEGRDCRWRMTRRIARTGYTESGRNLIALRLEILDRDGRRVESFDTYYVEDLR